MTNTAVSTADFVERRVSFEERALWTLRGSVERFQYADYRIVCGGPKGTRHFTIETSCLGIPPVGGVENGSVTTFTLLGCAHLMERLLSRLNRNIVVFPFDLSRDDEAEWVCRVSDIERWLLKEMGVNQGNPDAPSGACGWDD